MYPNAFSSIWEYSIALRAGRVDFSPELGPTCRVCGEICGYRGIGTYERTVIELVPYRRERVPIVRFRCGLGRGSFSLLPHQLAPYHQYTIGSMTLAVLCLCRALQACAAQETCLAELPPDSPVSLWHIRRFVTLLLSGFLHSHAHLCALYDLSAIESLSVGSRDFRSQALVTGRYFTACGVRGPPDAPDMESLLLTYGTLVNDFFCGTPSQERRSSLPA